ncbi:MAG: hypothetical protein P1U56_05910 [Saprospiraceae bacterium]|nr:hypothetical protein [Saprospiraceae bacterium]
MNFIALKASSGNYLSFELTTDGEHGTTSTRPLKFKIKTSPNPVVLKFRELTSGNWILQDAGSEYYLTAVDDGTKLIYAIEEKGDHQEFKFLKQADARKIALQVPDGNHYLKESPNGYISFDSNEIGPSEIFEMVEIPVHKSTQPHHHHGCCGPGIQEDKVKHTKDVYWDDRSHEGILHKSIALLTANQNGREEVRQFLKIWRDIPQSKKYPFNAGMVFQGIHDADYDEKYTDRWAPLVPPSYRTHFYNPISKKNYLEKTWNLVIAVIRQRLKVRESNPIPEHLLENVNAMTEGQRYFNLAVHYGRRIVRMGTQRTKEDLRAFGYNLGLSLHFLTDLTQPMHADNYTAVDVWPAMSWGVNFHGYFEGLVDEPKDNWKESRSGKALAAATITAKDIDYWKDNAHTSIGIVFHLIAAYSQPLLSSLGKAPLKEPLVTFFLQNTIQKAPNWVVRTMMALLHCSNQPLELTDNRWYIITEVTNKEFIFADLHENAQLRCTDDRIVPEDYKMFCLIFNSDGTCSFAVKSNPSLVWTKNIFGDQFYAKKEQPGGKDTSYKLLSGFENNYWIYFDQTGDPNALTVGTGSMDRLLIGEPPLHGLYNGAGGYESTNQLFKFDAGRPMTEAELRLVKAAQPTHGKYEWWGAKKSG